MIKLFKNQTDQTPLSLAVNQGNKRLFWAFGLVAGSWAICLLITGVIWLVGKDTEVIPVDKVEPLKQFSSESDFRNYFSESSMDRGMDKVMMTNMPAELSMEAGAGARFERVSDTNVQVKGIDEPDIVKTDGENIYVSDEQRYYFELMMERVEEPKTQIIQALPVETAKQIGQVSKQGDLLISGNTLLVLGTNEVTGFDVSDKKDPKEVWHYSLDDNRRVTAARLVNDKLILVTEFGVYQSVPCPLPLFSDVKVTSIDCADIWHPVESIGANTTYTVLLIIPENGNIETQVSFAGISGQTIVYVSTEAVFVSFTTTQNWGSLVAEFLTDPDNTLVDEVVKNKLTQTLSLDISDRAKQVEVEEILAMFSNSMTDDDRMKWETERTNQMSAYVDLHKREIEQTTIAKVSIDDFSIVGLGQVPGHPLNQFSLDEYKGNLRIATTVGGRSVGGGAISANDVYILDNEMKKVGEVTDMGLEERIYAVRFLGDKGYVVTFKETDPLYVLDLSRSETPNVTGELKIPGFSSYLHPLTKDLLLGIGKEDQQVKVSLFDVSDSTSPKEIDTYLLSDYWSEIQNTHHAFLQDTKYQVFFMPADKGGYIFSYADGKLTLEKTVADPGIKRALYINDNLYLISDRKISVVSEASWKTINTLNW